MQATAQAVCGRSFEVHHSPSNDAPTVQYCVLLARHKLVKRQMGLRAEKSISIVVLQEALCSEWLSALKEAVCNIPRFIKLLPSVRASDLVRAVLPARTAALCMEK